MRILNRPMFRYGGPIKQGIMHGMKNGGLSKQFNTGLVGDERYPKTGGREHHGFFIPAWLLSLVGGTGARAVGSQVVKKVGQEGVKKVIPKMTQNLNLSTPKNLQGIFDVGSKKVVDKVVPAATTGWKNLGKNWFSGDPTVKGLGWGWRTLTSPGANTLAQKAVKTVISPSSIIAGVAWYMWPDGKERKTPPPQGRETGVPGGGDPGMYYDKPPVTKTAEELAAEAKAARTAKLKKYLDTMGYDRAKKNAIGDALIDASAIVQGDVDEAGSLKKADWSKMINKAIQTTSKRLDKPEQIREAVGLMMTKADIEKDLEDPQTKELRRLQIAGAKKTLAGETLQESINAAFQRTGNFPKGSTLAGIARTKGIEITKVIATTDIPEGMSPIDYITSEVIQAKTDGTPIPEGHYVIKDRLVKIDGQGNITPVI